MIAFIKGLAELVTLWVVLTTTAFFSVILWNAPANAIFERMGLHDVDNKLTALYFVLPLMFGWLAICPLYVLSKLLKLRLYLSNIVLFAIGYPLILFCLDVGGGSTLAIEFTVLGLVPLTVSGAIGGAAMPLIVRLFGWIASSLRNGFARLFAPRT